MKISCWNLYLTLFSISLQGIMVSKRWNYVSAILLSLHIRPVHVISVSCRGANSIISSFTGFSHQQFACFQDRRRRTQRWGRWPKIAQKTNKSWLKRIILSLYTNAKENQSSILPNIFNRPSLLTRSYISCLSVKYIPFSFNRSNSSPPEKVKRAEISAVAGRLHDGGDIRRTDIVP